MLMHLVKRRQNLLLHTEGHWEQEVIEEPTKCINVERRDDLLEGWPLLPVFLIELHDEPHSKLVLNKSHQVNGCLQHRHRLGRIQVQQVEEDQDEGRDDRTCNDQHQAPRMCLNCRWLECHWTQCSCPMACGTPAHTPDAENSQS